MYKIFIDYFIHESYNKVVKIRKQKILVKV